MITRSLFYISLKIYNETWFVVGASAFPVALTQKFEKCQLAGEKYIKSLVSKIKDRGAFNADSVHSSALEFDDNTINSIKIHEVVIEHKGE